MRDIGEQKTGKEKHLLKASSNLLCVDFRLSELLTAWAGEDDVAADDKRRAAAGLLWAALEYLTLAGE